MVNLSLTMCEMEVVITFLSYVAWNEINYSVSVLGLWVVSIKEKDRIFLYPTLWSQMILDVLVYFPLGVMGRYSAGRKGGPSPLMGWKKKLPHGIGRLRLCRCNRVCKAGSCWTLPANWWLSCASTGPGQSHPWWESGLWAVALSKELSSSLALLFKSSYSGIACIYSAALPEDPERNCAVVLRKQIVLENRRTSTRLGCSEPHSTSRWMYPGVEHTQPFWATFSNVLSPSLWKISSLYLN